MVAGRTRTGGGHLLQQIVVGTDGSPDAAKAFAQALYLAQTVGCGLKCVFVVDLRKTQMPFIYAGGSYEGAFERLYVPPDPAMKKFYNKLADDLDGFADTCMENCRQAADKAGVDFESVVKSGYPGIELCDEVRSGGLLVVGKRGENAHYKRSIVGSITEDLLSKSPRPMLICPAVRKPVDKVLFPYDGSRSAEHALQFYVNGMKDLADDFVLLLIGEEKSDEHHVEEELCYLKKHNVPVRICTSEGIPAHEILKIAESENADTILMGARGRSKLKDYLLGSNASQTVHKSRIPVLVVF